MPSKPKIEANIHLLSATAACGHKINSNRESVGHVECMRKYFNSHPYMQNPLIISLNQITG